MEYDCRIFCEVIAPIMHIACRFVGELFDKEVAIGFKKFVVEGIIDIDRNVFDDVSESLIVIF